MRRYLAEQALIDGKLHTDVLLEAADGRWQTIEPGAADGGAQRLEGLVLPGMLNAHSHAFHRALRGRTHSDGGTFWTWRTRMYEAASRLNPDRYFALARATYAEMVAAGYTAVAEFHYVHHAPGGKRYDDPNAMGKALIAAAADAGIELTLLDVCYLRGGLSSDGYEDLDPLQQRFSDGSVEAFFERSCDLRESSGTARVGVAAHSVRALTEADLRTLARLADGALTHVHASEQIAEVDRCREVHGRSPIELLADVGLLHEACTVVHATHLSATDIEVLARSGASVAFCPTTERDLADGIGPAAALREASVPLAIGSDQHAVIDPFAEVQALEGHERLASHERGTFPPPELLRIATNPTPIGATSAGLTVGAPASAIALDSRSMRTAGSEPESLIMSASAADVTDVIVGGEPVVTDRRHRLGDVGDLLSDALEEIWQAH